MVTIKHCSDWVRVEHDGKVLWEGHRIRPSDLQDILSHYTESEEVEIPDEVMEQL